jgi:hypothetical protein
MAANGAVLPGGNTLCPFAHVAEEYSRPVYSSLSGKRLGLEYSPAKISPLPPSGELPPARAASSFDDAIAAGG